MLSALAAPFLGFATLLPSMPDDAPARNWLIASTGHCTHQTFVKYDAPVEKKGVAGVPDDQPGVYIGEVAFDFVPSKAIQFTDAPYREAFEIGAAGGADALADPAWDHKNVALVEHDAATDEWAISVYEVEGHAPCADTPNCIRYTGHVTAETANFPHEGRDGRFACQLFVDSTVEVPSSSWKSGNLDGVFPEYLDVPLSSCSVDVPVSAIGNCCSGVRCSGSTMGAECERAERDASPGAFGPSVKLSCGSPLAKCLDSAFPQGLAMPWCCRYPTEEADDAARREDALLHAPDEALKEEGIVKDVFI